MKTRKCKHAARTAAIIGTVVNAENGITAVQLTELLNKWGYESTPHEVSVKLVELAKAGRIERLRYGLYTGM